MPERLSLPREGTGRRKAASPGTETAGRGPGLPASGTARSLLRTPLGGWCPAMAEPTKMPCLLKREFGALARPGVETSGVRLPGSGLHGH